MSRKRFLWATVLLAPVPFTAASSAAQTSSSNSDVIVEARQRAEARERAVIEAFVKEIVDPGPTGQLPRWDRTVCSGIIGLGRDQSEVVNSRVAAGAALAGLTMGDAGCRPNVLTIISTQAPNLADLVARRFPVTLGRDGRARVTQFARSTQPVRWISSTDFGSADGAPTIGGWVNEVKQVRFTGSRLAKSTRAMLSTMLIIVDARKLQGMTLETLGDYLAMVALTRPRAESRAPAQSILAHFDNSEINALTRYDRGYISALYKAPASGATNAQAQSIRTRMGERDE